MSEALIPDIVKSILHQYELLLLKHSPGLVSGFYVHGSIALGAFCEGMSDIDFIAVLSRKVSDKDSDADVNALQGIHRQVAREYPHCAMDGSYLQWDDLGRVKDEIAPYPCFHDGAMHRTGKHDINPVTWWLLKHNALAIIGPSRQTLPFEIGWEDVSAYMRANLHTYWSAFTTSPKRFVWLLTDEGMQWAVLGVSRLLYGLRQGSIISKAQAGEYALGQVPERWHPLIQEALSVRAGSRDRLYHSRITRARDAAAYVKYVIAVAG